MSFLKRHVFAFTCLALAFLAGGLASFGPGRVVAQNAGQTLLSILPADLIQVYRANTAAITYATPAPITSQSGYFKGVPVTGFSYTFGNSQSFMALAPAGTIALGYVTFAPAPSDGARECVFTTQTITAFWTLANAGQTVNNGFSASALAANTGACYLYGSANLTWDRD